jgi:hypothetical protein
MLGAMSNRGDRSSVLPDVIEFTSLEQAVDEAICAYVDWRDESMGVWDAYDSWTRAAQAEAAYAHAAYEAALDREQAAANVYRRSVERCCRFVAVRADDPAAGGSPDGSLTTRKRASP